MKKYKSQALAMVLVIVIIGVIVALGLASRTNKNTLRNLDEKKAQDSTEVTNSLIDVSRSITTSEILAKCGAKFTEKQDCVISLQDGTYTTENFSTLPDISNFPKCSFSQSSDDVSKLTFSPIYNVEDYTLKKDEVLSFGFLATAPSCTSLDFNFTKIGSDAGGIVISKIYATKDPLFEPTGYKTYEPSDELYYFLGSIGTGWTGSWTSLPTGQWSLLSSNNDFNRLGYPIDTLRIRAVGADMKLNMQVNNCNMSPFFIKVTASSNCSGTSKSSYYYRPLRNNALPLFDFVLYNKNGDLKFTQ
jgi:hypothetical protein